jgi:hypothetical protein
MYQLFAESKNCLYYITDSGKVVRKTKVTGIEREMKPQTRISRGRYRRYSVHINGKEYIVRRLVAKSFIRDFDESKHFVLNKDGDITNNNLDNLILVPITSLRRYTGGIGNAQRVIVEKNGIEKEYSSINKAATALFVSPGTIKHYAQGMVQNSVLEGYRIELIYLRSE